MSDSLATDSVEVGPFSTMQIDEFADFLASKNIPYEIIVREDEMAAQLAQHNANNPTGEVPQKLNTSFTYFKVSQTDMERLRPDLENLGFFSSSTGEDELGAEDYMCTECDYHSHSPGRCPQCQIVLVDFLSYNSIRRENKASADKTGITVALVIGAIVALYLLLK